MKRLAPPEKAWALFLWKESLQIRLYSLLVLYPDCAMAILSWYSAWRDMKNVQVSLLTKLGEDCEPL